VNRESKSCDIHYIVDGTSRFGTDNIAVEEPLEINIRYLKNNQKITEAVSITMRTPGNDFELALGFLHTEGILRSYDEIDQLYYHGDCPKGMENRIIVELKKHIRPDTQRLTRHFYTSSSCGICGKASIGAINTLFNVKPLPFSFTIDKKILFSLPENLLNQQTLFSKTGGLHASALFDSEGNLLLLREDVGRHNALDKLIGTCMIKKDLHCERSILLLSGRISFELVQKAIMAGIPFIAGVGAPSSLAIELSEKYNISLVGFLNDRRFNIYTGGDRILPGTEKERKN
jgi:FdhD protein